MNGKSEYFSKTKTPTTKMKHKLFYSVLKTSLGTANNIVSRFAGEDKEKTYTYVDLYAGEGLFMGNLKERADEEDFGTPMYAISAFDGFLRTEGGKGHGINFDRLIIVACEKERKRRENLARVLYPAATKVSNTYSYPIDIAILEEWNNPKNSEFIKKVLKDSTFGLVFADPFNTELSLEEFKSLLSGNSYLHDIILFVNFGHIQRSLARGSKSDIARVSAFLGLSEKVLRSMFPEGSKEEDTIDKILEIFSKELKAIKGRDDIFVVKVALPLSVKGEPRNRDYFGLVLATGVFSVAQAFLQAYLAALKEFGNMRVHQGHLFNTLSGRVSKLFRHENVISLYEVFNRLWSELFSWKEIVNEGLLLELPTFDKVISVLNELYRKRLISYIVPPGQEAFFFYKDKKKGIKPSSLKREKHFRQIQIQILYKG